MNKDKHVLPDTGDTFANRIRREAEANDETDTRRTIYGPDNEPLQSVKLKKRR